MREMDMLSKEGGCVYCWERSLFTCTSPLNTPTTGLPNPLSPTDPRPQKQGPFLTDLSIPIDPGIHKSSITLSDIKHNKSDD